MLQFCRTRGGEQTELPKLLDNGKYSTFTQFLTKCFTFYLIYSNVTLLEMLKKEMHAETHCNKN